MFCNVTFCFYYSLDGPISACQRTADGKDYVNLGYAHSNPTVVSEGIIHLHYVNGMFPAYYSSKCALCTVECRLIEIFIIL